MCLCVSFSLSLSLVWLFQPPSTLSLPPSLPSTYSPFLPPSLPHLVPGTLVVPLSPPPTPLPAHPKQDASLPGRSPEGPGGSRGPAVAPRPSLVVCSTLLSLLPRAQRKEAVIRLCRRAKEGRRAVPEGRIEEEGEQAEQEEGRSVVGVSGRVSSPWDATGVSTFEFHSMTSTTVGAMGSRPPLARSPTPSRSRSRRACRVLQLPQLLLGSVAFSALASAVTGPLVSPIAPPYELGRTDMNANTHTKSHANVFLTVVKKFAALGDTSGGGDSTRDPVKFSRLRGGGGSDMMDDADATGSDRKSICEWLCGLKVRSFFA